MTAGGITGDDEEGTYLERLTASNGDSSSARLVGEHRVPSGFRNGDGHQRGSTVANYGDVTLLRQDLAHTVRALNGII